MSKALCGDAEGFGPFSTTRDFNFSPCFEDLVLIPLPHLLLILISVVRLVFVARHPRENGRIPYIWLYYVKWVFFGVAIAISLANLGLHFSNNTIQLYPITTAGMIFAAVLAHFQLTRYRRPSFILTGYYVALIIISAIKIRTMVTTLVHEKDPAAFGLFVGQLGVIIVLLILEQVPMREAITYTNRHEKVDMEKTSGPISQLIFQWMQPLMKLGFKKPLLPDDLYPLADGFTPRRNYELFEKHWEEEKKKTMHTQPQGCPFEILWLGVLSSNTPQTPGVDTSLCPTPTSAHSPAVHPELQEGCRGALCFYPAASFAWDYHFVCNVRHRHLLDALQRLVLQACLRHRFQGDESASGNVSSSIGLIRAALIAAIYRKSLILSPSSRQKTTTGEITNHMSVDVEAIYNAAPDGANIVDVLYQICLSLYFLYLELSWAIFAGLGVILLIIPTQFVFGAFWNKWQKAKMKNMDIRIRLMNEIIGGMKIVKLYAWERPFIKKILQVRNGEVKSLQTIGQGFSIIAIIFTCAPFFISLACFGVYVAIAPPTQPLNSTKLFVSMTLLQILQSPIGNLGSIMSRVMQAMVAYKRLAGFLVFEEIDSTAITRLSKGVRAIPQQAIIMMHHRQNCSTASMKGLMALVPPETFNIDEQDFSVVIKDGEFAWDQNGDSTLKDINLKVLNGSLVSVVGRVGMGKTSLISAILGEMYKINGSVTIRGTVAYVPQQAWIMNATLRDNIVFGSDFDVTWYNQVIDACSLRPDFDILPAGDMTEIGERGINLSGGQRQRISLARAVYSRADVYLFDDPLSAVDAHVDRHLFDYAIGPHSLLKGRTRILVTNAIHHTNEVDHIVVIKKGHVVEEGNFPTLMDNHSHFFNLMTKRQSSRMSSLVLNPAAVAEAMMKFALEEDKKKKKWPENKDQDVKIGLLTTEEFRAEGKVSLDVYTTYIKAATIPYALAFITAVFCSQGVSVGSRYWLQDWSATNVTTNINVAYNLGIYALFICVYGTLTTTASYVGVAVAGVRAARTLHKRLMNKVFRLPMSFFDTTPLGRIVNRFSKDVQIIDENLPMMIQNYFFHLTNVLGTVVVIAITTPIFLVLVPFIVYAFFWIQKYYLFTSRSLKRLESTSRSPIYAHFNETLGGISSIRAYNAVNRFIDVNEDCTTYNQNAFYLWVQSNRWLQMRIEFVSEYYNLHWYFIERRRLIEYGTKIQLGAFIVFGSAIFACLSRDTLSPGVVGLAVSYALSITLDITMIVRYYCDIETNIVSVERVKEYLDMPPEAAEESPYPLPQMWPQKGMIEFKNYATRYREDTNLVLRGISFKVEPGEKIGIGMCAFLVHVNLLPFIVVSAGRTGAGKSSLTLALFRIVESAPIDAPIDFEQTVCSPTEGSTTLVNHGEQTVGTIEIDGVDISKLGLRVLRSSLSIIPQEPVLFAGTVRENLDPFGEYDDAQIWQALEGANLKAVVNNMDGGLSASVSQGGDNFSVGQRQLVCLARALLRKTSILVLDEATGSIDAQTDEIIQATIRKEFRTRTVITIAHQPLKLTNLHFAINFIGIGTILDSDKILVLDKGQVAEFETPRKLLRDHQSLFYGLAHQAGEVDDDISEKSREDSDTTSSVGSFLEDMGKIVKKL
ncbi:hypothetical protein BC938DRAFT_477911 [Jimgerdemannia flammicorona]|uniref:P-loop containing nucleoside triphosphate hydrolase protein n=1 Tax=Jimgerdemannia flammicorona TaxID=994334 RepID=A0A433QNP1_9FUNG|nr:hypothetical protein BC938DRAFT_477911 [Jimgerdemannia flammicorona]